MTIPTQIATKKTKGAGSYFQVKTTGESDFKTLKGVENIPSIGGTAEYDETTRMDDAEREYTEKMPTPQELEIVFDDLLNDPVQQALIEDVEARATIESQIIYANGRIASFNLELTDNFQPDAETNKELMHAIKGRIRQLTWSKVA